MADTHNGTTNSPEVQHAENEALATQAAEDLAEQQFHAVRAELASQGKAHEATASQQFREWMAARVRTDEAWGRWAMAMDALRGWKPATGAA